MASVSYTAGGDIHVVINAVEQRAMLTALGSAEKAIATAIWDQHKEAILKDTGFVKACAESVASEVWEKMKTKIMAEMDLKGLASLIAVHAAKEFKNG